MIVEITVGQILIGFGIFALAMFLIGYISNRHDPEEQPAWQYLITGAFFFITFLIIGLNVDYGFLHVEVVKK